MGDFYYSSENYSLALEYFEKAYQHAQQDGPLADLWRLAFKIGDSYRRKGLYNEAREWCFLARDRLKGREETIEYGLVLDRIGSVLLNTGSLQVALQQCFLAYELLKNSPLHAEVAENLNRIAIIYMRLGYPKEAVEFFTDALVTFRRVDHHLGVTCATMNLGLLKKNACEFNEALSYFKKSLDLAKEHSLQKIRISLLLNIGIVYFKLRRDQEASEMFIRARRLAREAGDEQENIRGTISLGRVQARLGNTRRAEKLLLEGRVMAEKNDQQRSMILADEFLGELAELRGDLDAALANYELAMGQIMEVAPQGDITVELLQRIGRVKLAQGLPLEAIRLSDRALKLAERNGELFETPYLHRTLARSWRRLEDWDKAEYAFRNALRTFKTSQDEYEEDQTRLEYASFLFHRPTLERALRARKILEDLLQLARETRPDRLVFQASLLLARLESWLGDLDRALLAVFDAEGYLPEDASEADREALEEVRGDVEQRKIVQSSGHFGFLPGNNTLALSRGGREELSDDIRRAWEGLFELCEAEVGCLCMDSPDGVPFEFMEGMSRSEAQALRDSQRQGQDETETDSGKNGSGENGKSAAVQTGGAAEPPEVLYQPLVHSGNDIGFLCLWRKEGSGSGFSREMVRYLAGFARMVTLLVFHDWGRQVQTKSLQRDVPEAARGILTQDPAMLELLNLTGKVAETSAWVLLSGETGTGKGILAYAIHRISERRDRAFVHVNCAALPEELLESELFGHMKGSFTGAIQDKAGLIEEADGGTLFLDEVGKTSLKMQAKLLQFLDTREIRRVGANTSVPVDVRLITATKTDLMKLAQQGRFLEDLYYRLNDFPLNVPPLRERRGDIKLLTEHFLDHYSPDFGKRITQLTGSAVAKLEAHSWPGNVRELEKVVKRTLLVCPDSRALAPEYLVLEEGLQSYVRSKNGDGNRDLDLRRQIGSLEKQLVLEALEECSWNRTLASKRLGISYPTLLQKIRKYRLEN